MNKPANIALLVLAGVVAVGAQRFLWSNPTVVVTAESAALKSDSVEGRVLSVDAPATDESARTAPRYARVKLGTGETVRAIVGGCIIFPGQITRLTKYGSGRSAPYAIIENGRDDS